ncbi:MAG: TetR family transcriptional regulator [Paludibacter sp. 47-17]|jgi:AcrR family transcriptional regulator|nr:MAG: TetR family transcriptional regulator [Paludibacter sp. 47-17]
MSKKISKTKKMLIEVARELFAQKGKRNVTMNDIAEASKRGRRTLYTYFTNKEEIFRAVLNKELEYIVDQAKKAALENTDPDIRLRNLIITHLDAIKHVVDRNGSLSADFFRDIYEVERARRKTDQQEIDLMRAVLVEGLEKKVFKTIDPELSSIIIFYAVKGLEVPYIRKTLTREFEHQKYEILEFIIQGILNKPEHH